MYNLGLGNYSESLLADSIIAEEISTRKNNFATVIAKEMASIYKIKLLSFCLFNLFFVSFFRRLLKLVSVARLIMKKISHLRKRCSARARSIFFVYMPLVDIYPLISKKSASIASLDLENL